MVHACTEMHARIVYIIYIYIDQLRPMEGVQSHTLAEWRDDSPEVPTCYDAFL